MAELASRQWRHPVSGEPGRLGVSTIERWTTGRAGSGNDPVGVAAPQAALRRRRQAAIGAAVCAQPCWRNTPRTRAGAPGCITTLIALAAKHPELGTVPSYSTLRPLP